MFVSLAPMIGLDRGVTHPLPQLCIFTHFPAFPLYAESPQCPHHDVLTRGADARGWNRGDTSGDRAAGPRKPLRAARTMERASVGNH